MKNYLSRALATTALLACFTVPAFAQSYSVVGPNFPCEAGGACERGHVSMNFEGDGASVSVSAFGLVAGKDGVHRGLGSIEVKGPGPDFATLVLNHDAEFEVQFIPVSAPGFCASVSVGSIRVVGAAIGSGKFAELNATGLVRANPPFCPENDLRGQVVIAQGKGALKKASWGELKGSSR